EERLLPLFQSSDPGQFDSLQILERCAAARRNVSKSTRPRLVNESSRRVAAADEAGNAAQSGDCLTHVQRATGEHRDFEETKRPVPYNRSSGGQMLDEFGD